MAPGKPKLIAIDHDEGDEWCVTLEPGDFMCFWPPWNSGVYDT